MKSTCSALTLLMATLIGLVGCQSVKMPKGSSGDYTSFRFIKNTVSLGGDARFVEPSNDTDKAIHAAIISEMSTNDIALSEEGAELVVAYLIIKQDGISTMAIPTYYGEEFDKIQSLAHKKGVLKGDMPDRFQRGAIVIDVFDAAEEKLIYRDFAVRDLEGVTESDRPALINSAAAEALAAFFN